MILVHTMLTLLKSPTRINNAELQKRNKLFFITV